jgi:hypothetical protein
MAGFEVIIYGRFWVIAEGASQNLVYEVDLEGFFYLPSAGFLQALKVGRRHMFFERSMSFRCFVEKETSPAV